MNEPIKRIERLKGEFEDADKKFPLMLYVVKHYPRLDRWWDKRPAKKELHKCQIERFKLTKSLTVKVSDAEGQVRPVDEHYQRVYTWFSDAGRDFTEEHILMKPAEVNWDADGAKRFFRKYAEEGFEWLIDNRLDIVSKLDYGMAEGYEVNRGLENWLVVVRYLIKPFRHVVGRDGELYWEKIENIIRVSAEVCAQLQAEAKEAGQPTEASDKEKTAQKVEGEWSNAMNKKEIMSKLGFGLRAYRKFETFCKDYPIRNIANNRELWQIRIDKMPSNLRKKFE